jgi:hypothetical protein
MKCQYGGVRCLLKGLQQGPELSLEDGESNKWMKKGSKGIMLQLINEEGQVDKQE